MTEATAQKAPVAWQPLTAGGVAAFARARLGRLLAVQLVFALIAAGVVVWFLKTGWYPTISAAIARAPTEGVIRNGELDWHGPSPTMLAEGRFLALAVDLKHEGEARSPAHVQVEFGKQDIKVLSLFGFVSCRYPEGVLAFNRGELGPRWGAWAPVLLALAAGLVVVGLLATWALLATLYCVPTWLVGFYANRDVDLAGSWKLAGAALMPGALFMSAALVFYGLGALDQVRLLAAGAVHLLIGWVYLLVSPFYLPRHPAAEKPGNPFVAPAKPAPGSETKAAS